MKQSNFRIFRVIFVLILIHYHPVFSQSIQKPDTAIEYDEPLRIIKDVQPTYPPSALRDSIEGKVLIDALVNEHGLVDSVWVFQSVRKDLDSAALQAAKKRVFSPPKLNGKFVKGTFLQCYRFLCRKRPFH